MNSTQKEALRILWGVERNRRFGVEQIGPFADIESCQRVHKSVPLKAWLHHGQCVQVLIPAPIQGG